MKSIVLLLFFVLATSHAIDWHDFELLDVDDIGELKDESRMIPKELLKEVFQRYVSIQRLEKKSKEAINNKNLKDIGQSFAEARDEEVKIKRLQKRIDAEKEKNQKYKRHFEALGKFVDKLEERVVSVKRTLDREYSEQSKQRLRPLVRKFHVANKNVKDLNKKADEAIAKKNAADKKKLLGDAEQLLGQIGTLSGEIEKEREVNRFKNWLRRLQARTQGLRVEVEEIQKKLNQQDNDKDDNNNNPNFNNWARQVQIDLTRIDNNLKSLETEGEEAIKNNDSDKQKAIRDETQNDLDEARDIRRQVVKAQDRDDITDDNRRWLRGTLTWIDRLTPRHEKLINKLNEQQTTTTTTTTPPPPPPTTTPPPPPTTTTKKPDNRETEPIECKDFNKIAADIQKTLNEIDNRIRLAENEDNCPKLKEQKSRLESDVKVCYEKKQMVEKLKKCHDLSEKQKTWLNGVTKWLNLLIPRGERLIEKAKKC